MQNSNVKKSIAATVAMMTVLGFSSVTARAQTLDCGCIDAVFVIDDTGSMGGAIDNIKASLPSILATIKDKAPSDVVRIGVVGFKDTITVYLPYTANDGGAGSAAISAAINSLTASGGAGKAETSDEALRYVATGASACPVSGSLGAPRAICLKKVFLATDAPPGGCDDNYVDGVDDTNSHAAALLAAAAGFRVNAINVNSFPFTSAAHPGGVEAFVLNDMATTTGGTYTEVPGTGEGTANAIIGKFADCGGAGPVPAMSEWGVAALLLIVLTGLTLKFGRKERVTA